MWACRLIQQNGCHSILWPQMPESFRRHHCRPPQSNRSWKMQNTQSQAFMSVYLIGCAYLCGCWRTRVDSKKKLNELVRDGKIDPSIYQLLQNEPFRLMQ